MTKTIKPDIREVKATDLALLAAAVGPKAKPGEAVEAAMRFYLRASVELDGIKGHHIESLFFRYFKSRDADALLKKWRVWNRLPALPPDEPLKIFKHYPDKEPTQDEVWQRMNDDVRLGKRPDAVLKSLKRFLRTVEPSTLFQLRKEKDGAGKVYYPVTETFFSAWRAFAFKERAKLKEQGAQRVRKYRAKHRSSENRPKNARD